MLALSLGTLIILSFLLLLLAWRNRRQQLKLSSLNNDKLKYESRLQEYQKRFDTVFENANVGMVILNLDGSLVKSNNAFCDLFGYGERDVRNINFFRLLDTNDLNTLQEYMQQLIEHKITSHQSEQQCYRKNGEDLWILSTLSLISDKQDKPLYFIAQIQNITPQKKAEERYVTWPITIR